jgi:hypothetical protein
LVDRDAMVRTTRLTPVLTAMSAYGVYAVWPWPESSLAVGHLTPVFKGEHGCVQLLLILKSTRVA